ncbi:MAG: electron transfer flavoprotein subunit beta/FixA family protein [Bacteroidetes bacterium]|nr:electron transfer flavoprotein subunit beta/FixA family protein [Bacteroidota bacterium]MBU1719680.1 electron transfer flavoprotein subunit beta/FixA family protein [Bacteroidota bacterium]
MKILVCISNVPDTTTKIRFKDNNSVFDTTGVQWIINPWDELALTRALELKETSGGAIEKVTVATVGLTGAEPTIRKALAIGADDAFRVDSDPVDAYFTAAQLAEVVKKEGYDLVFCGIESSDYNGGAVGGMLSEILGFASISSVSAVNYENGAFTFLREIDGGKETLSGNLPLVAIVQKGIAINPRIPNMRGIMNARSKPLVVIPAASTDNQTQYVNYELPPAKAKCKMVDAENMTELVHLLHTEAKVI